jgi:hypothetical protein
MTRDDWIDLAERCEKAARPDREIDALIWQAVYPNASLKHARRGLMIIAADGEVSLSAVTVGGHDHPDAVADSFGAHRLTASIEAATALIQRELPEIDGVLPLRAGGEAWLWPARGPSYKGWRVTAATPALSACAAFCRAKAAMTSQEPTL